MSGANGTGRRFSVKRLIMDALKGAELGLAVIGAIVLIGLLQVDFRELASNTEEVVLRAAEWATAYVHMRRGLMAIVAAPALLYPLVNTAFPYFIWMGSNENEPEGGR